MADHPRNSSFSYNFGPTRQTTVGTRWPPPNVELADRAMSVTGHDRGHDRLYAQARRRRTNDKMVIDNPLGA